jgi:two-component system, OmpR family, response regulator MprA
MTEAGVEELGCPVVLVVEDDRATRVSLSRLLQLEGYEVVAVPDGVAAIEKATGTDFDLILLDRVLPFMEGTNVCKRLRSLGDPTPILMLSGREAVNERVEGLDSGADDYLTKPFAREELLARARALLRRSPKTRVPAAVEIGDLYIDVAARRAMRGEHELSLTRTEFDLLELLARNARMVMTRTVIYERIWGYDFGSESKNLPVYIGYLRHKLEENGASRLIHTVRGIGYMLREPDGAEEDDFVSSTDAAETDTETEARRIVAGSNGQRPRPFKTANAGERVPAVCQHGAGDPRWHPSTGYKLGRRALDETGPYRKSG